jgi:HSP20 family protein
VWRLWWRGLKSARKALEIFPVISISPVTRLPPEPVTRTQEDEVMNLKNLTPWTARDRGNAAVRFTNDNPVVSMHRQMNRLFDDLFRGVDESLASSGQAGWPRVEVRENDKEFKVYAELPGLEQSDVEVTYADGIVTLKGEKRMEEETAVYNERWAGAFERQIVLSDAVDPANVKATFKNGVLTVVLGKKAEAQRQMVRIEVN